MKGDGVIMNDCVWFQIKGDVYVLTNVPARHQIWSGWPAAADDDTVIYLYLIAFKQNWYIKLKHIFIISNIQVYA
jgi:hypothetical protein